MPAPRRATPPAPPDWLVARPIAHRGLHDAVRQIVENSIAAVDAAIAHGCAVECDVQITADGEAVVFHDFDLQRLTGQAGRVDQTAFAALPGLCGGERPQQIPAFSTYLAHVAGRVPVICEIKSRFGGDMRLADRAVAVATGYDGPLAFKSFDPAIVEHLRGDAALARRPRPLGMVAEAHYDDPDWHDLSPAFKFELANFLHFPTTRPEFVSYAVCDLPHAVPLLCRVGIGIPVMAWTVRTAQQRATAALHADQMVFEGFLPDTP